MTFFRLRLPIHTARSGGIKNQRKFIPPSRVALHKKSLHIGFLCAASVFSVSLWCVFARNSSTTETQRTQRLHREEGSRDFLCKVIPRSIFEMHHWNRTTNSLKTKNGSMKEDGTRACLNVFGLERSQAQRQSRIKSASEGKFSDNVQRQYSTRLTLR